MIEPRIREQITKIGRRNTNIKKIILFGSRAIGDNADKSDIDLAFVAPNMKQSEWTALSFSIEEELDTLLFLDLVKFEDVSMELKNEIMNNGELLYHEE